ncbi:MAG: TonB-dependent receptor, partial [Deltaproteobacteria bacterium]|nr:TonB-dependent receptor [Deltaproteobacteria bacterium]
GANGEPLLEAQVTVARTKQQVLSDLDGRYRLELRPGIYELRFWAELHRAEIVRGVRVEAGKVVQLDSVVPSDETAVDVVEVETEADRAAVEGQILTRQRAAAVGDSVGRAEIARTPDRNAAQAAQRLVGATVVGGRFVYVRGLGERYTNALLNDAPLPSPEPDRAAVPLDLFPTMAINSLTIVKTFTPDVPGDFAGGSVRIETREIPSRFVLQASVSGGYNSQATFRTHEGARTGGSLDWLGIDDGTRALPGGFPTYKLAVGSQRPDGTAVTGAEVDAASRSINSYFSTRSRTLPPDHSMSVVAGNGFSLGGDQKLGVLGAVSYGRSYELQRGRTYNEFGRAADGSLNGERVYRINLGGEKVTWGALGSVTYQANRDHRFTLLGMHSQIADNAAQETTGFNNSRNAQVHDQRLLFVERGLNLGQLRGEHRFPGLDRAELGWSGWISDAARNEPDTRNIAYNRAEGSADYTYVDDDFSGRHFWSNQTELVRGGKVDWTQPLGATESKVKTGVFVNLRERDFDSRSLPFRRSDELSIRDRESYAKLNCPAPAAGGTPDFQACGDALMNGANLGPVVRLREATLPEDAYRANLDVYAGYLMSDVALSRRVRVIAGERVEVTRQETTPFDQFNPDLRLNSGRIRSTDLLPSLSAVFELDPRTKVRASATRTLARPQLRELAPFAYTDYFGGRFVSGNPDLTLTRITNADVRVEHFPTLKEVL